MASVEKIMEPHAFFFAAYQMDVVGSLGGPMVEEVNNSDSSDSEAANAEDEGTEVRTQEEEENPDGICEVTPHGASDAQIYAAGLVANHFVFFEIKHVKHLWRAAMYTLPEGERKEVEAAEDFWDLCIHKCIGVFARMLHTALSESSLASEDRERRGPNNILNRIFWYGEDFYEPFAPLLYETNRIAGFLQNLRRNGFFLEWGAPPQKPNLERLHRLMWKIVLPAELVQPLLRTASAQDCITEGQNAFKAVKYTFDIPLETGRTLREAEAGKPYNKKVKYGEHAVQLQVIPHGDPEQVDNIGAPEDFALPLERVQAMLSSKGKGKGKT